MSKKKKERKKSKQQTNAVSNQNNKTPTPLKPIWWRILPTGISQFVNASFEQVIRAKGLVKGKGLSGAITIIAICALLVAVTAGVISNMITQPSTPAITPAILSTSENVALLEKLQIDSSINFADQNFARAMGYYKNGQIGDAFSAIEKPMKLLKDSSTVPLDEDLANKHDLFATICSVLGKHELAIESFATLQGYYEGLGEQGKMNLARAFRGLGIAYDETGKPQMAEQMLGNALHIPLFTLQFDR